MYHLKIITNKNIFLKRFRTNNILYKKKYVLEIIDKETYLKYLCKLNKDYFCIIDTKYKHIFIINNKGIFINNNKIIDNIQNNILELDKYSIKNNIMIIYLADNYSCAEPNLKNVEKELVILNKQIYNKCKYLKISFDIIEKTYSKKFKTYIIIDNEYKLSLYYKNKLISTILLLYHTYDALEIRSNTVEKYEGNKFNKLLRMIIILLSSLIICKKFDIIELYSQAVNPISAWLLINNFNTVYSANSKKYEAFSNTNKHLKLKEFIWKAYKNGFNFDIYIKLDKNNIKIAKKLLKVLLSNKIESINCL